MMKTQLLAWLLLGLLLVSFVNTALSDRGRGGGDDDDDGAGDDSKAEAPEGDDDGDGGRGRGREREDKSDDNKGRRRDLGIDVDPHRVRIRAEARPDNDTRTRVDIEFTTNGFPRLRVTRRSKGDNLKTQFTHRFGFRRLLEFFHNDSRVNASCFSPGLDQVVSQFGLIGQSSRWTDMTRDQYVVTAEDGTNTTVEKFCTSLTKVLSTAKVTLCLRVADRPVIESNRRISPTRIKLDFILENYQFRSSGTYLALVAMIQNRYALALSTTSSRTLVVGGPAGGTISWDGFVETESGTVDIIRSALFPESVGTAGEDSDDDDDDDDELRIGEIPRIVAFCTNTTEHFALYKWDPTVTSNEASVDLSGSFLVAPSAAVMLVLLAVLFTLLL